MGELVFVVNRESDSGFSALAVGESIHVQAESWEELRARIVDALVCHVDSGDLTGRGFRPEGAWFRLVDQVGRE